MTQLPPPPPPAMPPQEPGDKFDQFAALSEKRPQELDWQSLAKRWWPVAPLLALVLLGAINPRIKFTDDGLVAMSCTTKTMLLPNMDSPTGLKIKAGVYNPESLTKALMKEAKRDYMTEMAGNPFAVMGVGLMSAMEGPMEGMVETAMEDACNGEDVSWLSGGN